MRHPTTSSSNPVSRAVPATDSRVARILAWIRRPHVERSLAYVAIAVLTVTLGATGAVGITALVGVLPATGAAGVVTVIGWFGIGATAPSLAKVLVRRALRDR